jgi:hypothetical protein
MHKTKTFSILGAAAALALAALALAACGSNGGGASPCGATSKCSADTPPSQSALNTCYMGASGPCGSQFDAVGICALAQQICGADNKTNSAASLTAVETNCASELAAYQTCCAQGGPSACPVTITQ